MGYSKAWYTIEREAYPIYKETMEGEGKGYVLGLLLWSAFFGYADFHYLVNPV
ncbi:MAG: hypothetical protein ACI4D2_05595 [Lachnospiraceae bacterium]